MIDTIPPVIHGVPNDTIVNCDEIPELPILIYATDECLCACVVLLEETYPDMGCQDGQVLVRTWIAKDDCGNETIETQNITLIDSEAPVLIGVPDVICIGDPALSAVSATDNCGQPSLQFVDVNIPNPCGSGMVVQRVYEAYDNCGNMSRDTAILLPNNQNEPSIEFVNPVLAALEPGEVPVMDCAAQNGQYTSFGIDDVRVEDACMTGGAVFFTERIIETRDCSNDGIVAVLELKWTVIDACGNLGERTLIVHLTDRSSPAFVNFAPEVTIGCNDELPVLSATDDCGEVYITTQDSIILGDCVFRYDIQRLATATDQCGNTTTRLQTIHVGEEGGPIISGVQAVVCDDRSLPAVTAYDPCAAEFVPVTMQEDTLDMPCPDGIVIERLWTAVSICGDVTEIRQTIILNDSTPPAFSIPLHSIIHSFVGIGNNQILLSQTTHLFRRLDALDEHSVVVLDDCDAEIIPVFTLEITYADDCERDGYSERRTYTWTATDVCGNSSVLTFTVEIIDDVPPTFGGAPGDITGGVPSDTTIICEPLPLAPVVRAIDPAQPAVIVYSESVTPGDRPGVYIVTRTWTATDACGNTSTAVQHITWIPDTFLECEIILPDVVECNAHGVVISSGVTGGIGPITYEWEIEGDKCFIQAGQGTPEIIIYVGWSDVKIILTVTDEFGCVSTCTATLHCLFSPDDGSLSRPPDANPETGAPTLPDVARNTSKDDLHQLNVWPNPATGSVNLSFESAEENEIEFSFINLLGQAVLSDKISAHKGFNTREIDISQIHKGSYLIQVKTEKEIHTKVIVIMRND